MDAIAREIQAQNKSDEVAKALEMPPQRDIKILLERWQKEMDELDIPTKQDLMFHLSNLGFQDLHDKSV